MGKENSASYDLLNVPEGYVTSLVLLVAPYFDAKFMKTLVKKLVPEKIRVVVDDGARAEDIKQLIKAANGRRMSKSLWAWPPALSTSKGITLNL